MSFQRVTGELPNAMDGPEKKNAVPDDPQDGAHGSAKREDIAHPSHANSHNDAIDTAAVWLHEHRAEITGRIIPALKKRFQLAAAKRAHGLAYGGAT